MSHHRNAVRTALLLAIVTGSLASFTSAQGGLFVTITAPTPGSTVGGTITVRADASPTTVAVRFTLDGATLGVEDTTAPYSIPWNTTTASNGSHTLRAVARDVLGLQWTSEPVTVTVFNDLTPPSVAITAPAPGASVSGAITVAATASDNVGVTGVQFKLDGANLGAEDTAAPYALSWNTLAASSGSHTLTAVARDAAGNTKTSGAVTVTVDNAAPSVAMTAPSSGAIVSGTLTVSADASDNIAIVGVQFFVDGAPHGAEDTSAPYSAAWNTTTAAGGSHTLTARARDAAGHTTTSAGVTVTVDNAAPSVAMTAPASGATVSGTVTMSASASDNLAVAGVQFFVDGSPLGAEDTGAPYSATWNTTTASAGSHTLTARARDTAGNTTTSAAVTVTVDNAAPSIVMTAPSPGATLSGTVALSANASDDVAVAGVQFLVDGVPQGAEDTSAPYSTAWNTTTAAPGSHTLTARARDAAGNSTTSAAVTVTVDNAAPSVSITAPTAGSTVSGTITVNAGASDNVGVIGVQFKLDGANLGAEDTAAPYTVSWNTLGASNGSHTLTAVARDAAGNSTTAAAVTVTVDNGAPTVSITGPAAGSTVSGTITVSAAASDTAGVVGVQFRLDGANLGAEDTTAPYAISWDTPTASNGVHTLTAVARDTSGNSTTSAAVTVTVDNAAPSVSITAPAAGSYVSGTRTVSADASDNISVAGVQFRLDGAALGPEDTIAPYTANWNTVTASNGSHTLTAVARDAAGNSTTSVALTVTVDNAAPSVSVTAPAGGSTVSGTTSVSADASDNATVAGVQFRLDGANLGAEDTAAPFGVSWDTLGASNGSHTLTAVARDGAGNTTTSASITVTVNNDQAGPSVTITAPASGGTVSATISVSADASDNSGVAGVQFRLDGANLGPEDTTAPYTVSWDTRTASDGSHTLTAVARDTEGNSTTSASVTVTVDNAAPSVSITAPAAGSTVSGTATVNAAASDNVGVAGVQFFVDGTPIGGEDTSAPYSTTWDSTTAVNGSHTLTARARDAAGNATISTAITVTVANGGGGTTLRIEDGNTAIAFDGGWNVGNTSRPWSGGTAAIGFGTGQDAFVDFRGTGITWIGFTGPWSGIANVYMDGTFVRTLDLYAPGETVEARVFTATGLPLGPHTLRIEVTRTKNASSADYVVVVDAFDIIDAPLDANAPAVTITSPSGGTTVFGTVPVTASASDDTGVAAVTFFVDGTQLGSPDTISPFSVNWTTSSVADGQHTLTATARDAAGNTRTSAPVTVTVANTAPPTLATATRIENNHLGITYVDGCVTCGQVPTWFHGSRSRGWSDGTASFNRSDGGRATFTFTGTGIKWIGFRATWAGIARVFIDGAFVAEVDLYRPNEEEQVPVFQIADLAPGNHTIAVEATGRKNPDAQDYAVVVDAFDVTPALPPPVEGTRHEESAPSTTFTTGWTQKDASQAWSGGTAATSGGVGERATFVFNGTSVNWIGRRAPDMGIARVYLDGAFQAQVDTYYPTSVQGSVYSITGLAPGAHRLEIEVTGLRHANATGHTVVVDAFDVRARIEENDAGVTYTGTWAFNESDRNWSDSSLTTGSGTASRSSVAGARAEVRFTGTAVSWIGLRGPAAGIADVYIDGVFNQRVDLYAPAEQVQVAVFTASGLAPGAHTLRVDVTGEQNASAIGARVLIDAFDVTLPTPSPAVTRVQETSPAIAYTAGWTASGQAKFWSGENATQHRTVGARATFSFTGTAVRWIGERGFSTGVARVLLDGVLVGNVDTRTPFQEEYQEALLTLTGLAPGSHTLTIEVIGRSGEAPGTVVEQVVIDAFDSW